ncbi:MAG: bifunctional isocitrate dehydrogenase kinase/phosphatase [Candidatus Rokubacteria bacterium]|nr:bifunctional isocitrate dehydrogenase kinase/phosphatase [Candidatus Rokubacteria bacterium]
MRPEHGNHSLPAGGADAIRLAFDTYRREFKAVTRRARSRFEGQDWRGMQQDARERLDVYPRLIARVVGAVRHILGEHGQDRMVWAQMKAAYTRSIARCADFELAETFFNSVTRRMFATVGVDPKIEYVDSDFDAPLPPGDEPVYRTYAGRGPIRALVRDILADYSFSVAYQDIDVDARLVADEIDARRQAAWGASPVEAVEILKPVFYRNKGAYLIGRIRGGTGLLPLALALLNTGQGIVVDAALLTEDEVSIVFSFTHSYFHVDVERPHEAIQFLRSIMPLKRVAELYIALGYNKHGKTELYRDLLRHLERSTDKFEIAPGDRGMVMVVFTVPSYDVVFKVIRDDIPLPKTTTRRDVLRKYQLVFNHDRAGRLADAQEFEHLAFARDRFSDALLAELMDTAAESVSVGDGQVVFKHLYTQRRMTPLNLYLRDVDAAAAHDAAVEYGQAIKDLAATNIFPGDLLLKNFGVTRHGRVAFYDYDELCPLTDCNFREMPQARDLEEELASEPWFYVGDGDLFPEEFITFMGLQGSVREVFLRTHRDLLRTDFWRTMQARHTAGEVIDIFPYRQSRRLRGGGRRPAALSS